MSVTKTKAKTTIKKVFTRLTLDNNSLRAVARVQNMIPNYDLNDAVRMIFGLGISQLDNILPEVDDNGFTKNTKAKLLKAKQELENGGGTAFKNSEEIVNYVQNLAK
jgi:hypothetical protein